MSGIAEFFANRKVIPNLNLNIQYPYTETETIMTVDCYVTTVSEQLLFTAFLAAHYKKQFCEMQEGIRWR
jgi:hypothetical protein